MLDYSTPMARIFKNTYPVQRDLVLFFYQLFNFQNFTALYPDKINSMWQIADIYPGFEIGNRLLQNLNAAGVKD